MPGQIRKWQSGKHNAHGNQHRIDGFYQKQRSDTFHIRHHLTAPGNDIGQVGEFRIDQHHLCHGFCGGSRITHGHTKIGFLEGKCVVHTIAGHRHHMATAVQCLNDRLLLFGQHTTKHIDGFECFCQLVDILRKLPRIHRAGLTLPRQMHRRRNGAHGDGIIPRDDPTPHALPPEP